jgi:hypothetical protein
MTDEFESGLDTRTQAAVNELRETIRQHYPEASFELSQGFDEPEQILLTTIVDLDDPDEVLDLVLDRLLELEIDEGIPLYVIPISTPERTLAQLQSAPPPWRRVHVEPPRVW